ncbi:MAG: acyl transferase [Solirubrobacteraceae bacterium]
MNWDKEIFAIQTEKEFNELALVLYKYQSEFNPVYAKYLELIAFSTTPKNYKEIPFLPINFFKNHKVSTQSTHQVVYESSKTTSSAASKHYVYNKEIYLKAAKLNFEANYGSLADYTILALLPNYLERTNSSLIEMVQYFMTFSNKAHNGFYLYNHKDLHLKLIELEAHQQTKILLIGVAFALIDFFSDFKIKLKNTIVMETGGMKGRKKELTRKELHNLLKQQSGLEQIHSEYGMTELLSQCYSKENEIFNTPNWMKILIRDVNDPFLILNQNTIGGINIIDLANIYSCCFLASDDLGIARSQNTFEIIGRFDNSDVRGCNLMAI